MSPSSTDQHNAAMNLVGVDLPSGWHVQEMLKPDPASTGGVFSVSYIVRNEEGRTGFCKVINYARALTGSDPAGDLAMMTSEYVAERDLLMMCSDRRLSRVVTAVDHGQFTLEAYPLTPVSYIIFELATSDIRVALTQGQGLNSVLRLVFLRNIATGMRQLHQADVVHQDVKPSNLLVFDTGQLGVASGKLADLGRAHRRGVPSPHDAFVVPGDRSYAPPEQLYGYTYPDEAVRRNSADLFQLGSIASFMFTGLTINAYLAQELAEAHHWSRFGDSYTEVLPYVEDAFARVINRLHSDLPPEVSVGLTRIIEYLCQPDATLRGHPAARRFGRQPFALERVVSDFNLLSDRVKVAISR